jgi:hypothetical protein
MSAPSCATLRGFLFTQLFFSVFPGVGGVGFCIAPKFGSVSKSQRLHQN